MSEILTHLVLSLVFVLVQYLLHAKCFLLLFYHPSTSTSHLAVGQGEVVTVNCYPLEQLLRQANNTHLTVDYFSLDTEGSELAILRSINFTQITFGVVGIEHNNRQGWKMAINRIMTRAGYVGFTRLSWAMGHADVLYYNPVYFAQRGIPLPTDDMKCP